MIAHIGIVKNPDAPSKTLEGKIADCLLRGSTRCDKVNVLTKRTITTSVHEFRGCGYDHALMDNIDILEVFTQNMQIIESEQSFISRSTTVHR